jgi:tRNA(Ser,Leu) C12 N-acetylase TAN1
MKDWNVVITSHMWQEDRLLKELAGLGEFRPSGFAAVILGKVQEVGQFLEVLRVLWNKSPFLAEYLSSVVPIRIVFPFTVENIAERLREEVRALAPEIGDRAFYVRMKRRGHKGEFSSQEVEQALDRFLTEEFCSRGQECRVDFETADIIVAVETIHNQCGLGLITREMKERYPFIKVK